LNNLLFLKVISVYSAATRNVIAFYEAVKSKKTKKARVQFRKIGVDSKLNFSQIYSKGSNETSWKPLSQNWQEREGNI
jgi:hypothetical protein